MSQKLPKFLPAMMIKILLNLWILWIVLMSNIYLIKGIMQQKHCNLKRLKFPSRQSLNLPKA